MDTGYPYIYIYISIPPITHIDIYIWVACIHFTEYTPFTQSTYCILKIVFYMYNIYMEYSSTTTSLYYINALIK